MPGTERVIAFSQLAVKGLKISERMQKKNCLIFSEVEAKISEIREFSESSPACSYYRVLVCSV
jgi:hypothetical protein